MTNSTGNNQLRMPASEVRSGLDRVVQDGDTVRADGLDGLARLRAARTSTQQREAARLAQKLGPDHPRVVALQARVAADPVLTAQVRAEAARARTQPLSVGGGWAVHGHVRTEDGKPVPGLTAALYNSAGRRVEGVGWGCTDAAGYFLIRADTVPEQVEPARLHLVDASGRHVYVEPRTLTPAARQAVYLPITLGKDAGAAAVCNPPPDDAGGAGGFPPDDGKTELLPGDGGATGLGEGEWSVHGTVTGEDGAPLVGVTVSLYDRDLFFDDRLGQTTTDDHGRYRLVYHTGDFRDFIESRPDLYVRILDPHGKELHTQPAKIRTEAGKSETLDVRVGKGPARSRKRM